LNFYTTRKPRTKDDDWTPTKIPITVRYSGGKTRTLWSPLQVDWRLTEEKTMSEALMPVFLPASSDQKASNR